MKYYTLAFSYENSRLVEIKGKYECLKFHSEFFFLKSTELNSKAVMSRNAHVQSSLQKLLHSTTVIQT